MTEEKLETSTETVENACEKTFTIKDLLEAGVHFGHRTMRWNPKMAPYIYGSRNGIHIIDLTQTVLLLNDAMRILREVAKKKGKILFVCTKKQGADIVAKMAENCGQYHVTNKWLGGMLTNWKTISQSIRKIKSIENQLVSDDKLVKKEKLYLQKQKEKLEENFNGIKSIGGRPDLVFVIDVPKENLAIAEAKSLHIPVMAITDTNADPDKVDYVIPGNDDSIKAIQLYCDIIESSLKEFKQNPEEVKVRKQPQSQKKSKFVGKGKTFDKRPAKKTEKTEKAKEEKVVEKVSEENK